MFLMPKKIFIEDKELHKKVYIENANRMMMNIKIYRNKWQSGTNEGGREEKVREA